MLYAFLLMDQPADEKAMIITENGKYRLKKNLPGQWNAAAQKFCQVAKEFGLEQDAMQPTMMRSSTRVEGGNKRKLYLTIHVDDLLIVGVEDEVERFIKFMESKSWRVEKTGPLYAGPFHYLKRSMEIVDKGVTIRPDQEHIKELAKVTNVLNRNPRSTPGDGNFTKLKKDDEAMPAAQVTLYRSAVGKLLIHCTRQAGHTICGPRVGFIDAETHKERMASYATCKFLPSGNYGRRFAVGAWAKGQARVQHQRGHL